MWGIPEKNYQKLAQECKLDHSNVLPAHEMTRSPFSGFSTIVIPIHTAPECCQPEMFATLSFSAVLIVCDQDKNLHVGQQIF